MNIPAAIINCNHWPILFIRKRIKSNEQRFQFEYSNISQTRTKHLCTKSS